MTETCGQVACCAPALLSSLCKSIMHRSTASSEEDGKRRVPQEEIGAPAKKFLPYYYRNTGYGPVWFIKYGKGRTRCDLIQDCDGKGSKMLETSMETEPEGACTS